MTYGRTQLNKIIAVLIVMSLLAYALIAFLPHRHTCVDTDCAVCAIIESARNILPGLGLSVAIGPLVKVVILLSLPGIGMLSVRDGTPVGLKVKLSN